MFHLVSYWLVLGEPKIYQNLEDFTRMRGFQLMKSPLTIKKLSKKDEMRGNEGKLPKITTLKKPSPQIVTRSPE